MFEKVGKNNIVKGNGSFVVIKDSVFYADYYYDYNDGKELTLFTFNTKEKSRLIDRQESGPLELGVNNRRLSVFRRAWRCSYKEYAIDSLCANHDKSLDSIAFSDVDQLQKVNGIFVCAKISGGGPHILDIYNSKGKLIGSVDPYNGLLDIIPSPERRYILGQGCLGYNKSGNYVIYASAYMGIVTLFDVRDNSIIPKKTYYIGESRPRDVLNFRVTSATKIYAQDICSDDSYTYVLYKDGRVTDKFRYSYILRLDKYGHLDCLKASVKLLRICAANNRLYGLADCGSRGAALVSANLSKID